MQRLGGEGKAAERQAMIGMSMELEYFVTAWKRQVLVCGYTEATEAMTVGGCKGIGTRLHEETLKSLGLRNQWEPDGKEPT